MRLDLKEWIGQERKVEEGIGEVHYLPYSLFLSIMSEEGTGAERRGLERKGCTYATFASASIDMMG